MFWPNFRFRTQYFLRVILLNFSFNLGATPPKKAGAAHGRCASPPCLNNFSSFLLVNLDKSTVCSLPEYSTTHPVMMAFINDKQMLVACGDHLSYSNGGGNSCYQLLPGETASWQMLPGRQVITHCPTTSSTKSHYLENLGWFVIGRNGYRRGDESTCTGEIHAELLTAEAQQEQWIQIPISTRPHEEGFPSRACTVAINNSTALIVTGGRHDRFFKGQTDEKIKMNIYP